MKPVNWILKKSMFTGFFDIANLQILILDTVEANQELGFEDDMRDYALAAQMLKDLEVKSVNLMTNNPRKIRGLDRYGINVVDREEIEIEAGEKNKNYLQTKKDKLGHLLEL